MVHELSSSRFGYFLDRSLVAAQEKCEAGARKGGLIVRPVRHPPEFMSNTLLLNYLPEQPMR
jgi:hypothetical protein